MVKKTIFLASGLLIINSHGAQPNKQVKSKQASIKVDIKAVLNGNIKLGGISIIKVLPNFLSEPAPHYNSKSISRADLIGDFQDCKTMLINKQDNIIDLSKFAYKLKFISFQTKDGQHFYGAVNNLCLEPNKKYLLTNKESYLKLVSNYSPGNAIKIVNCFQVSDNQKKLETDLYLFIEDFNANDFKQMQLRVNRNEISQKLPTDFPEHLKQIIAKYCI